jgi:hypothetical protein
MRILVLAFSDLFIAVHFFGQDMVISTNAELLVSNANRLDSHAQLLVDAAEQGSGHKKTLIPEEEAKYSYQQVGTPEKGYVSNARAMDMVHLLIRSRWLAFQPYVRASGTRASRCLRQLLTSPLFGLGIMTSVWRRPMGPF